MNKIESILSSLPGVQDIIEIPKVKTEKISQLENNYGSAGVVSLQNLGMKKVFEREFIYAIIKDKNFRLPPGPTVYMVEDSDESHKDQENILSVGNKYFYIIGEELIGDRLPEDEKYIHISSTFILYSNRRKGKDKNTIPFPYSTIIISGTGREKRRIRDL